MRTKIEAFWHPLADSIWQRLGAGMALALLTASLLGGSAAAIADISQGYASSGNPALGSLVSLQANSSGAVEPATTDNVGNLLGVVIDAGSSPLSLTDPSENQVQVATSGIVEVLVSNLNGYIASGDHITASPIGGVGMRTNTNVKVIGIAQSPLTAQNGSQETYTDKSGQKHSVVLGQIPVMLNVSYYFKQPNKSIIPGAIQSVADALAGKSVSSLPIFISAAIFLITVIIVVSIIYAMIRSSIISVGRNPLSQAAVLRGVVQLSALVLAILSVSFGSIYMVLTKV